MKAKPWVKYMLSGLCGSLLVFLLWGASQPASPSGGYRVVEATPVRTIDGDTFVARVEGREETIRLAGVDAPELETEATVESVLEEGAAPAGVTSRWTLNRVLCTLTGVDPDGTMHIDFEAGLTGDEVCPDPGDLALLVPPRDRDRYGRLLAWAFVRSGSELVSVDQYQLAVTESESWYTDDESVASYLDEILQD